MTASCVSAVTIFDGAKGATLDEIREKKVELKEYLKETVDAWKKASLLTRSEENYNEREKVDDDVSIVISKTIRLSIDAVKAATGAKNLNKTVEAMTMLRARTYKAVKEMPPLCQPEDELAPPSQRIVDIWKEAVAELAPDADWIPGGDDIALGGDAAATAVNAAVNNAKPPKSTLGALAGAVSTYFSPSRTTRSSGIPPTTAELPPTRKARQSTPAGDQKLPPALDLTAVGTGDLGTWVKEAAATVGDPPQSANDVAAEGEKKPQLPDEGLEAALKKEEEETAAIEKRTKEKIEKAALEEKKVEKLKEEKEKKEREEAEEAAAEDEQKRKEEEADKEVKEMEEALQKAKEKKKKVVEEGKKKLETARAAKRRAEEKEMMADRRLGQLAARTAELSQPSKKLKKTPEKKTPNKPAAAAAKPSLSECVRKTAADRGFDAEKTDALAAKAGALNDAMGGIGDAVTLTAWALQDLEAQKKIDDGEWNLVGAGNATSHRPSPPKPAPQHDDHPPSEPHHHHDGHCGGGCGGRPRNAARLSPPARPSSSGENIMSTVGLMQAEWLARSRLQSMRPAEKFAQGKQN